MDKKSLFRQFRRHHKQLVKVMNQHSRMDALVVVSGYREQSVKVKVKAFMEWYFTADFQDTLVAITRKRVMVLADESTHGILQSLIELND